MSAIINHSYIDFFAIAVDAYNSNQESIYTKLMMTIIGTYKSLIDEIELYSIALDKNRELRFSDIELENFYEDTYDTIDIIKLYKKKIETIDSKDRLLVELHDVVDRLHTLLVEYLDSVSTLEVKKIQKSYANVV